MKMGFRKPSLKKRLSARTSIRRQIVHRGGFKMPKGAGWIRNPKKAAYNYAYHRTTVDPLKAGKGRTQRSTKQHYSLGEIDETYNKRNWRFLKGVMWVLFWPVTLPVWILKRMIR